MDSRPDTGECFWYDSPGQEEILAHSCFFQPSRQLDALVEASRLHQIVVLTGKAGAGKSSLATALAWPEIAGGRVPDGFVHAIAILTSDTDLASLGDDLARQLPRSVPGFAEAIAEFGRSVNLPDARSWTLSRGTCSGHWRTLLSKPSSESYWTDSTG